MTKRLTLVGLVGVAVLWGPWVYSELVRKPLPAASAELRANEPEAPVVQPTPVAYEPTPTPQAAPTVTVVEPALAPPPAAPAEPEPEEPAVAEQAPQLAEPPHETAEQAVQPAAANPPAAAEAPDTETAKANPADKEAEAPKDQPAEPEATAKANPAPEGSPAELAAAAALAPAFRSAFDHEARDAQWAEDQEPRLTQLMSKEGLPANAITEVRCQSTVCRISFNASTLEQASPTALAKLMQRVHEEFGTSLGLDLAKPEGEQHAAFYLLRKGAELSRGRDAL
ncbi:MAG TPA: hypothetical protein VJR89_19105 [Polyangiales bacterium]|nr:hypothetical protein [Polyangiales bacterium]